MHEGLGDPSIAMPLLIKMWMPACSDERRPRFYDYRDKEGKA